MKTTIRIFLFVMIAATVTLYSCEKDPVESSVTTADVTNIASSTVTAGGEVTDDGGADVTARGVCYSRTNANPTIEDNRTTNGTGTGAFTSELTGLLNGSTYHVRAYSTNSVGTSYGIVKDFTTIQ